MHQTGGLQTSNFSLFYNGPTGLYKQFWETWLKFRVSAKPVKIQRVFDASELREFDFSRKIMIHGVRYLIKSIQVTFKKNRIMPATMECYVG